MIAKELEKILKLAFQEAKQRRHEFVCIEHLLYALLQDEESRRTIVQCGGDVDELKKDLEEFLEGHLEKLPESDQKSKAILEQMIIDFQKERTADDLPPDGVSLQQQIDTLNERVSYLSQMFLTLDRQIKPLYEAIRLTYQKSDILNQRINTLINSIRTGDPL